MRGQLVEVRAGATATYGGSMERETKLWQVKPTGWPSSMPDTIVTPVANRPMASLNRRGVERCRGTGAVGRRHRFLSSKVPPSLAALTWTLPADWATCRAARSMVSICRSV